MHKHAQHSNIPSMFRRYFWQGVSYRNWNGRLFSLGYPSFTWVGPLVTRAAFKSAKVFFFYFQKMTHSTPASHRFLKLTTAPALSNFLYPQLPLVFFFLLNFFTRKLQSVMLVVWLLMIAVNAVSHILFIFDQFYVELMDNILSLKVHASSTSSYFI